MKMKNKCQCQLSPLAMGLSLGCVWGLSMLFTGLLACYFSYGKPFVLAMSTMYVGYEPSVVGSLIGGAFGFIDGLIGGLLIGWFYNCFVGCSVCCCNTSCETPKSKSKK